MTRDIKLLAGLLIGAGALHFAKPKPFEQIVPKKLPYAKELVLVSGAVEIAAGAMLLDPRSRRFGGVLAAGLLAAVFPANVQMAADGLRSRRAPAWYKIGLIARLPLQAPMIRIALKAVRS